MRGTTPAGRSTLDVIIIIVTIIIIIIAISVIVTVIIMIIILGAVHILRQLLEGGGG